MSFDTLKRKMGRKPVCIVEIDLDYCDNTYGVAPCTAAVGVTGTAKSFNTRKTCQDPTNYAASPKTYRFSNVVLPPSSDLNFIGLPCISSWVMAPTVIDPNNGIGKRASVTVSLKDFQHSDFGIDKYLDERGYDSKTRGTFFLKLLARNPYYQNRAMRVKVGYLEDGKAPDAANFETRLYLIQSITGPDAKGNVQITAQDPLKLLDDKRAKEPIAYSGVLYADITPSDLTATLTPTGIGDDAYPTSGLAAMGDELAPFTRSGDVITFTSRGSNATTAASHNMGDSFQVATVYEDEDVTAVLYDLLVTKAGIPASYINLADWNAEADIWLSNYSINTVISKPVGINQLVGELAQQCLFYIWWDERTQLIQLAAIHPLHNVTPTTVDETSNIIADSQSRTETPNDRKTQVWVYFGQKNPTIDLDKPYNYSIVKVGVDPDAEGAVEYGDSRVEVIWSRWLDADSASEAEMLARRRLNRYRDNPKIYKFKLDAKDSDLWTGDVVEATIRSIIDFTGEPLPTTLQILVVNETVPGSEFEYTLQDTQFVGRYAFWAPDDEDDFTDASAADLARYAWWADDDGVMSDATEGFRYV